jgi:hypothetical protein
MIIRDFYLVRFGVGPAEDDAPLVVDPDRIKVLEIPSQFFSNRFAGGTVRLLNRLAALIASNLRFALRAMPWKSRTH